MNSDYEQEKHPLPPHPDDCLQEMISVCEIFKQLVQYDPDTTRLFGLRDWLSSLYGWPQNQDYWLSVVQILAAFVGVEVSEDLHRLLACRTDEIQRHLVLECIQAACRGKEKEQLKLLEWAAEQRDAFHNGDLTEDQVSLLESIPGWSWGEKAISEVNTRRFANLSSGEQINEARLEENDHKTRFKNTE